MQCHKNHEKEALNNSKLICNESSGKGDVQNCPLQGEQDPVTALLGYETLHDRDQLFIFRLYANVQVEGHRLCWCLTT